MLITLLPLKRFRNQLLTKYLNISIKKHSTTNQYFFKNANNILVKQVPKATKLSYSQKANFLLLLKLRPA